MKIERTKARCVTDKIFKSVLEAEDGPQNEKRVKCIRRTNSKGSEDSQSSKKFLRKLQFGNYVRVAKLISTESKRKPNKNQPCSELRDESLHSIHKRSVTFLKGNSYGAQINRVFSFNNRNQQNLQLNSNPVNREKSKPEQTNLNFGVEKMRSKNPEEANSEQKEAFSDRLQSANIEDVEALMHFPFQHLDESTIMQKNINQDLEDYNQDDLSSDDEMQGVFELVNRKCLGQTQCEKKQKRGEKYQKLYEQCYRKNDKLELQIGLSKERSQDLEYEIQRKQNKIIDLEIKLKNGENQGSNRLILQDQRIFELIKANRDLKDELQRKEYNIQILNEKLIACEDSEMAFKDQVVTLRNQIKEKEKSLITNPDSTTFSSLSLNSSHLSNTHQQLEFAKNQILYLQSQLLEMEKKTKTTKQFLTEAETKLSTVSVKFKHQKRKIEYQAEGRVNSLISRQNELQKELCHYRKLTRNDEIDFQLSPDKY